MIGKIQIQCSANNPNVPLKEIVLFRNSSSAIEITNVPDLIGKWKIIGLSISVIYPDTRIINKVCQKVNDNWVCTLPFCNVAGKITKGYSIIAQIQDETGVIRNGFVIGCGDISIINLDYNVVPETTFNYMRYTNDLSALSVAGDFHVNLSGIATIRNLFGLNILISCDTAFLSSYASKDWVNALGYLTSHLSLTDYASKLWVEDKNYLTAHLSLTAYATNESLNATNSNVATIQSYLPNEVTDQNKLADKNFVNSSITTNTAYFKGTFNSVAELPTTGVTNNDYAFVIRTDAVGLTYYDRYKYNSNTSLWVFEYSINNSGFTAVQYAAINSGITTEKVSLIDSNTSDIAFNSESITYLGAIVSNVEASLLFKASKSEVYLKSDLSTVVLSGEYDDDSGDTFSFELLYKL